MKMKRQSKTFQKSKRPNELPPLLIQRGFFYAQILHPDIYSLAVNLDRQQNLRQLTPYRFVHFSITLQNIPTATPMPCTHAPATPPYVYVYIRASAKIKENSCQLRVLGVSLGNLSSPTLGDILYPMEYYYEKDIKTITFQC